MKYIKKPVAIEATQWFKNGDHPEDYANKRVALKNEEIVFVSGEEAKEMQWEGEVVRYFRRPDVDGNSICDHCSRIMDEHGWIDTLEGGHIVCPGDFIITGVNGERYPCKPDIFVKTYEPVNETKKAMNKEEAIKIAKQFRKEADELLQRMKGHRRQLGQYNDMDANGYWEVIAQHTQSIRDLESCIMRQGMVLKCIGNHDPYPTSKDPSSTEVHPTADGLKL